MRLAVLKPGNCLLKFPGGFYVCGKFVLVKTWLRVFYNGFTAETGELSSAKSTCVIKMFLYKHHQPVLKLPKNKKVHETEIGHFWLSEGILYGVAKEHQRSLKNISKALDTVKDLINGSKVYFLVDLTIGRPYSLNEKKLIKERLFSDLKAIAILSASPLGKMLGQIVYAKESAEIPVREFSCAEDALDWIEELKAMKK
jgi:hypothetical protein